MEKRKRKVRIESSGSFQNFVYYGDSKTCGSNHETLVQAIAWVKSVHKMNGYEEPTIEVIKKK